MDTDELSDKTYKAILGEAEAFNPDLTLHFGMLSYECKNERAFIKKSVWLIKIIMKMDEDDLEDLFFGNPPEKREIRKALEKILDNISKL